MNAWGWAAPVVALLVLTGCTEDAASAEEIKRADRINATGLGTELGKKLYRQRATETRGIYETADLISSTCLGLAEGITEDSPAGMERFRRKMRFANWCGDAALEALTPNT